MELPGGWRVGTALRHYRPYWVRTVLFCGRDRILMAEGLGTPIWIEAHFGVWRRYSVKWTKLMPGTNTWWSAQKGNTVVVVGYGKRPAIALRQDAWRGMVPKGHGATAITLPNTLACHVMAVTEPIKQRVAN